MADIEPEESEIIQTLKAVLATAPTIKALVLVATMHAEDDTERVLIHTVGDATQAHALGTLEMAKLLILQEASEQT